MAVATQQTLSVRKKRSGFASFFIRLVKEKPLGAVGGFIVLVLLLVGIFADVVAPYGMNEVDISIRLQPPSAQHLLGTDNLGRDLYSRIIYGARISVVVGLSASLIGVVISTAIGLITGYFGGAIDMFLQRIVDAWMSFPSILILITVMSIVGRGIPQIILVLGLSGGIVGSRVVRGAVIAIQENMYIDATRAIGCSSLRILSRHIMPNIMAPIIIIFTTSIGGVIMAEASLSFLGLGVPPGIPTWGSMLSLEGKRYMELAPQLALWPGAALSVVVYGMNMFGDAVRDLLDPRLRGGLGWFGKSRRPKLKKKKGGARDEMK